MNIKDDFIDELLKYDYVSKKKGRGMSSILMNKVGKGRVNQNSQMMSHQNNDDQINSMRNYEQEQIEKSQRIFDDHMNDTQT